jgi:hypothetical protein
MRLLRMRRSGIGRRWSGGEVDWVLLREEGITPIYTDEHRLEGQSDCWCAVAPVAEGG